MIALRTVTYVLDLFIDESRDGLAGSQKDDRAYGNQGPAGEIFVPRSHLARLESDANQL